ncbi:zinc-finger homeodomain protein 4-like [Tripterygium wilfordii]|uniref:zinc-finger homeodomain protein 4-like n=1 Tax=Tripterygium wilfordii TaxID=458696 RepID=UPI0018F805D6|nr:zinc-finger homeodomain protein 4-like [Tripterygium wilfordii]
MNCSSEREISAVSRQQTIINGTVEDQKKSVRYMECLKNHAASIGGNSTDGCGEFMPSGEQGTLESLICSACNCHRNFHRKVTENESPCPYGCSSSIVPCKSGSIPSESDEKDDQDIVGIRRSGGDDHRVMKKRFRTKFTTEQKEKMLNFAEKACWSVQKVDDCALQQFCQEIGIKRRVLKVWMHNNKHNYANKNS